MDNSQRILLKRSKFSVNIQIIVSGILAILLVIVAIYLLGVLFGWTPNEGRIVKAVVSMVIIVGWIVSSLKLWLNWNSKKYEITKDAFIVHGKSGKWGSSQAIYRYESIISIKMTQGFWGKKYNYGDVHLNIPKLDKELVMYDIERPIEQLQEVQKRINERSNNSATLVT